MNVHFFFFTFSFYCFCIHSSVSLSVGSPGDGVTNACELPCGSWEVNPGPLDEQSVFFTTESPLQHLTCFFETGFWNAIQTQYRFSILGAGITGGHHRNQLLMSS